MRSPSILSALLLCGATAFAQQSVPPAQPHFPTKMANPSLIEETRQPKVRVLQSSGSCPVGVSARRSPIGTTILTGGAQYPAKPVLQAVLLHVAGQIAEIEAIAYGPEPGAHVVPVRAGDEQSETFTLIGAKRDADGDFHLHTARMSTVQRIAITSITFTDGSIWTPTAEHRCVVEPSGFMPI